MTVSEQIREHLDNASHLLNDRQKPDYRNSIKESISAVESAVGQFCGKPKEKLGKALELINAKHPLHAQFQKAIENLYSWTSDHGGIRHHLMDNKTPTRTDAQVMLVVCSAFVLYLAQKAKEN